MAWAVNHHQGVNSSAAAVSVRQRVNIHKYPTVTDVKCDVIYNIIYSNMMLMHNILGLFFSFGSFACDINRMEEYISHEEDRSQDLLLSDQELRSLNPFRLVLSCWCLLFFMSSAAV